MIPTIEQIKPLISKRSKGVITFVAVMLNLFILAFFLFVQLNLDDNALINHLRKIRSVLKKKYPENQWAALNAQASQLGNAPVVLVQAPPSVTTQQYAQPTQKQPQLSSSERITKTKKMEETQLAENIEIETHAQESTEKQEKKSASLNQAIKAALAKKLKEHAKKIAHAKKTIPNTQQPKQTLPSPTKIQASSSFTEATKDKQKITFAQLVQGFTEHLKHEGEYTISMAGKSGAKATEHQLRVGRFLQKIIQCMQTSWKVNRNRYPLNHRVLASIVVRVVINKDGTLNNLIIQKTSGRQIIDDFVLSILKDAGKSFPPIPNYLNQEVCIITCNWEKIPLPEGPTGYTITQ